MRRTNGEEGCIKRWSKVGGERFGWQATTGGGCEARWLSSCSCLSTCLPACLLACLSACQSASPLPEGLPGCLLAACFLPRQLPPLSLALLLSLCLDTLFLAVSPSRSVHLVLVLSLSLLLSPSRSLSLSECVSLVAQDSPRDPAKPRTRRIGTAGSHSSSSHPSCSIPTRPANPLGQ